MLDQLNKVMGRSFFPLLLKCFSLLVYIALIIIGLSAGSSDTVILKELRNTNLANLIVWSYWWPIIIVCAIYFGRVWCMVCPVEVITTFFARIGFKRARPEWLRSGWIITVFYIVILVVGIQGFDIHRNPKFMAFYLLTIVIVSILVGIIYKKNTFCRYICPVGYLLGLYSRLSFLGWRVKNKDVCDSCKDKSCISKNYHYHLINKSCGNDLYPADITDNSACIICAGCLKTCRKYQSEPNNQRPNPQFIRIGFANDLFRLKTLKPPEMIFIFVVSGFVISEILSEWSVTDKFLDFLPNMIIRSLPVNDNFLSSLIKSAILFVIIPLILWMGPFLISRLAGATIKMKDYFLNYGIAYIPIIAAAHLDKSILKTTSRIPYFEHVWEDPAGISVARKIIDGRIVLKQIPSGLEIILSILLVLIIGYALSLSFKVVRLINKKHGFEGSSKFSYLIPTIYGSIFLIMILVWRSTLFGDYEPN